MKPGHLALFVLCAVLETCPPTWANGVEFQLNKSHDDRYDQLLCSLTTNQEDKRIFSIIEIAIIDFTNSINKLKLASASVLESDVYVQNERNIDMRVNGRVSRYHAELDIRFVKQRNCEFGNYLCELTFMNLAGHIDKIHTVVKARLPEDIRSNLTDNSELILMDQLDDLRNHFDDRVNLLANRTEQMEESLARLTGEFVNATSLLEKAQQKKQSRPLPCLKREISSGTYNRSKNDEGTAGSRIDFVSSPDTITLGLTRNLTLRCSFSDTVDQSNASVPIIGRRQRKVNDQDVSSRDVSPTFNTQHVISAIISKIGKKNETVASVALGSSPTGYLDTGKLAVQGHVLSQPGERAYLELTWPRPGPDLCGTYECRINAIDAIGFPIFYVQNLKVDIRKPYLTRLVQHLWEIEEEIQKKLMTVDEKIQFQLNTTKSELSWIKSEFISIKYELNATKSELDATKSDLNLTKSDLTATKSDLTATKSDLTATKSDLKATKSDLTLTKSELKTAKRQIASMRTTMNNLTTAHAEQGMVYCLLDGVVGVTTTDVYFNYSETRRLHWSNGREITQHVVFNRPYNSPPAVLISANTVATGTRVKTSGSYGYSYSLYQATVHDVTTHGFNITCSDPHAYDAYVQNINVYWMSTVAG